MRLINCRTICFEEFFGKKIPRYAILSHTWGTSEISFKNFNDALSGFSLVSSDMSFVADENVHKIINTCSEARKNYCDYVWIDSCCIDKSSSAELSEAINSMYKWYQNASRCYVYLSDFEIEAQSLNWDYHKRGDQRTFPKSLIGELGKCRWFKRGWTLQELLAPRKVMFYDRFWHPFGSRLELAAALSDLTRIPRSVLNCTTISYNYCAAQKMSWAAMRETTREEDMAYCLFGLFGVNLPLLYGEGAERAFIRLQEEIMKENNDLTLFAWQAESEGGYRGILARSPGEFKNATDMTPIKHVSQNPEFTVTNKGLRIQTPLLYGPGTTMFMPLNCTVPTKGYRELGIYLVEYWGQIYRETPRELFQQRENATMTDELIYITKNTEFVAVPWQDHASVLGPPQVASEPRRQKEMTPIGYDFGESEGEILIKPTDDPCPWINTYPHEERNRFLFPPSIPPTSSTKMQRSYFIFLQNSSRSIALKSRTEKSNWRNVCIKQ